MAFAAARALKELLLVSKNRFSTREINEPGALIYWQEIRTLDSFFFSLWFLSSGGSPENVI